jgi:hypothetical protein
MNKIMIFLFFLFFKVIAFFNFRGTLEMSTGFLNFFLVVVYSCHRASKVRIFSYTQKQCGAGPARDWERQPPLSVN